jgi:uncharacterized phage infection (PIP) family protein YhgE
MSDFGFTIGVDGEREFKSALRDINSTMKVLGSEMKLVSAQFDSNNQSQEALTARTAVLNKEVDEQKRKLELLQSALDNASSSFGENDERTKRWQVQLNNAQAELVKLERELDDNTKALNATSNEMDDAARSADKLGDEVKKTGDEADKAAEDIKNAGEGRISLEGLTLEGNQWLHISSKYNGELGVWAGGVDVSQYIDLNDNSFFRLPVNTACVLTISDDTYAATNVWVYVYEYYLTV